MRAALLDVEAALRVVEGADGLLLRVLQIGQERAGVDLLGLRHLLWVEACRLAKQAEDIRRVHEVGNVSVGLFDHGPRDHEWYPDPCLVWRGLRAHDVEWHLHRGSEGSIVPDDHDHCVGALGFVDQLACVALAGEAGRCQQAAQLGVHGLDHGVRQNALDGHIGAVGAKVSGGAKRCGKLLPGRGREQVAGRGLQGRVVGTERDGGHPWRVAALPGLDPLYRRIDLDRGAVVAPGRRRDRHLAHLPAAVDDER